MLAKKLEHLLNGGGKAAGVEGLQAAIELLRAEMNVHRRELGAMPARRSELLLDDDHDATLDKMEMRERELYRRLEKGELQIAAVEARLTEMRLAQIQPRIDFHKDALIAASQEVEATVLSAMKANAAARATFEAAAHELGRDNANRLLPLVHYAGMLDENCLALWRAKIACADRKPKRADRAPARQGTAMNNRQAIAEIARELSNFSLPKFKPYAETACELSIKRAATAVADLRSVLADFKSLNQVSAKAQALRDLNRSLEDFHLQRSSGMDVKKKTPNSISGYGAIFGTLDSDNEIIDRGAFAASLAQSRRTQKMPLMLWQHQTDAVIGVWDSIVEDGKGLLCNGRLLPNVQKGREAQALLAAKAIGDLSIGFKTVRAANVNGVRHIQQVNLFEVSLVSFASNSEACVVEAD